MLKIIAIFVIVGCIYAVPSIRTGMTEVILNNLDLANFTLNFNSALPNSSYNYMVNTGYVYNYLPPIGYNLWVKCFTLAQTGMACQTTAANLNNNSRVFLTYLISQEGNLLCGLWTQQFFFNNKTTSYQQKLNFSVPYNKKKLNSTNAPYINLVPYVSGISTLDGDFALQFGSDGNFNVTSGRATFSVFIQEMHAQSINITFGFIIFDGTAYLFTLFQNMIFNPQQIQANILLGISAVKRSAPPKARRLQVVQNSIAQSYNNSFNATVTINGYTGIYRTISYTIPGTASVQTTIQLVNNPGTTVNTTNYLINQDIAFQLTNGGIDPTMYCYKYVAINTSLFNPNPDGILDTSNLTSNNYLKLTKNPTTPCQPSQTPNGRFLIDSTPRDPDSVLFNNQFSTDGFILVTQSASVKPYYYFQISPFSDPQAPLVDATNLRGFPAASLAINNPADPNSNITTTNAPINPPNPQPNCYVTPTQRATASYRPVFYRTTVQRPMKNRCVGYMSQQLTPSADNFHMEYSYVCNKCPSFQVFDPIAKTCVYKQEFIQSGRFY